MLKLTYTHTHTHADTFCDNQHNRSPAHPIIAVVVVVFLSFAQVAFDQFSICVFAPKRTENGLLFNYRVCHMPSAMGPRSQVIHFLFSQQLPSIVFRIFIFEFSSNFVPEKKLRCLHFMTWCTHTRGRVRDP